MKPPAARLCDKSIWQLLVDFFIRDQGGMPRGFAFVEMENETEAANAISGLNGSKHEGRVLTVNEAQQKSDRRKRMGGG
jgi:RNA recognition motif-containing protein